MTTSAIVGMKLSDGKFLYNRVNWDGYISHLGKLLSNITIERLVREFINGDEIRCVHKVEDKKGYSIERYDDNDEFPFLVSSYDEIHHQEYNYIFDDGVWYVTSRDYKNEPLEMVIMNEDMKEDI